MNEFEVYLAPSGMVDINHSSIQQLVKQHNWQSLEPYQAIGEIYQFVRDEITFGYNRDDGISASQVLKDGYGQCNTKGTLLIALLRAVGIPARFHGFTIDNELQKGAIPNYLFFLAPKRIIHSWVEVYYDGRWLELEGYIIDKVYLSKVQQRYGSGCSDFSGYGIATKCLSKPQIDWQGENTYIQKEGIADDFGIFTHPDEFYQQYGSNLTGIKRFMFRYLFRHLMNLNVNNIREKGLN